MALIKFGLVITDGRGKIGGHVLTKGRSGNVIRTKVTPVNPNTTRQSSVRGVLTAFSQGWKALTQAQRDAWNAAVSNFTRTNIFGDTVLPTGKNLFTSLNTNLSKVAYSTITAPPLPLAVVDPEVSSAVVTVTGSVMEIDFAGASANQKMFIQASPPVSPGITNISSKMSLIAVEAQTTPGTLDIWADYVAVYGVPPAGQKIFFKVAAVRDTTGQSTTPAVLSAIVAA